LASKGLVYDILLNSFFKLVQHVLPQSFSSSSSSQLRLDKTYELFKYTHMVDSSPGIINSNQNYHHMEYDRVSLKLKCDFNLNTGATTSFGHSKASSYEYVKYTNAADRDKIKAKLKWFKLDMHTLKQLHEYYLKLNFSSDAVHSQNHLVDAYITSNLDNLLKYSNSSKLISNLVFKFKNTNDLISTYGLYLCKFDDSQFLSQVFINGEN
jgi:hypothetical protein